MPLRAALAQILRGTGIAYRVEPDVRDIPLTMRAQDVELSAALRAITRLGGVTYRREGEIDVIRNR